MPYIYHPSRIIYYSSTHFVLFYHHYYLLLIVSVCFYFCSHYGFHHIFHFFMADANAIYLSPKSYYLLLINTLRIISSSLLFTTHHHSLFLFNLFFLLPHTSLLMADANATYHPSFIIYYSSIYYSFIHLLFSHQPIFFPPWMVDANFIFILVFTSSYFCFILRMRHGLFILSHFIYNVLPLLYTFSSFMFIPHCKYFLSCILFYF